jgi:plastocyanin
MGKSVSRREVIIGTAAFAVVLHPSASAAESSVHDVEIKSFAFEPMHIQVRIGDTIRWTNRDLAPHTATADELGWDTTELARDESGDVVVTKCMETSYFCVFHPHMKGTIQIVS